MRVELRRCYEEIIDLSLVSGVSLAYVTRMSRISYEETAPMEFSL